MIFFGGRWSGRDFGWTIPPQKKFEYPLPKKGGWVNFKEYLLDALEKFAYSLKKDFYYSHLIPNSMILLHCLCCLNKIGEHFQIFYV